MRGVRALGGANPYGGVRPRALARVFPKLTKLRAALSAPNTSSAGVHACRLVFRGVRGAGIHAHRRGYSRQEVRLKVSL